MGKSTRNGPFSIAISISWLVVWNIFIYFSIQLGKIIIPTDFQSIIFQRGRYATTNQCCVHLQHQIAQAQPFGAYEVSGDLRRMEGNGVGWAYPHGGTFRGLMGARVNSIWLVNGGNSLELCLDLIGIYMYQKTWGLQEMQMDFPNHTIVHGPISDLRMTES